MWGENSAFEYGGADEVAHRLRLDRAWLRTYGVTHGTTPPTGSAPWAEREGPHALLRAPDDASSTRPACSRCSSATTSRGIPQKSLAVARAAWLRARPRRARTGYYDYADIDDDFISLHHWIKWYKFGFTRRSTTCRSKSATAA